MSPIIQSSLEKSMSYAAYRELLKRLVATNSTTGLEKTEALINYTMLNDRRMKRWDKTVKVPEEAQHKISEFNHKMTWLVISESWCGDAAHVLPVLNKIAELNDNVNYRVVLRDENPELMDAFLTNGNRAIPKLIIIDNDTGEVMTTYGPRPSEATGYVKRFKAKNNMLTAGFKEDLQHWYNKNKGVNVIDDITEILGKLQSRVYQ
ncbi:thioredoxin family protein [Algibacter sp. 2305UL17-15]|uniref:thioredoxin family protein n=1 Tax=Algibacter sp. 2305UL17-15 TaxID=3231268 RepID=UPI00345A7396